MRGSKGVHVEEHFVHDMSMRKRGVKKLRKRLVEEARHLLVQAEVPLVKVSRRLKLPVPLLKRIMNNDHVDVDPQRDRRARVPRFHKIHDRARDLLNMTLTHTKTPMTLRNLQALLAKDCQLRVSRVYLGQYLRVVTKASYRMIKPIMPIHNELRCKL